MQGRYQAKQMKYMCDDVDGAEVCIKQNSRARYFAALSERGRVQPTCGCSAASEGALRQPAKSINYVIGCPIRECARVRARQTHDTAEAARKFGREAAAFPTPCATRGRARNSQMAQAWAGFWCCECATADQCRSHARRTTCVEFIDCSADCGEKSCANRPCDPPAVVGLVPATAGEGRRALSHMLRAPSHVRRRPSSHVGGGGGIRAFWPRVLFLALAIGSVLQHSSSPAGSVRGAQPCDCQRVGARARNQRHTLVIPCASPNATDSRQVAIGI
jgi:hypothetical protein